MSGDAFAATPIWLCRLAKASGAARSAKAPTSTRRTKLCAARRTAAPGCSCLGLLMDFLDKDLLDKYLLAIPLTKGRLHLSPDAKGSSSTEHCVGGNLLMDLPPMASKCRSPRLLPSTPPWTRTSWMDLLDLLSADMAARLGDLRLDPAPAQRHRLRQVHRQPSQRLRAAARKPAKPQLDTKQVMTSQVATSSSSSTSWNSMMGPTRGVRWRGEAPPAPPLWKYEQNDLRAYSKFAKKIALWRIQVASFMTPREAALVLYTSLTGEAEAELEHASIESINSDKGVDLILETLRQPMEQKQIFQKRNFLSDFEGIQRQPGEGLKAFSNRYRRIERNLKAVGIEVALMYDSEARGNRLLERARLTPQDQRLILVGCRYSLAFEDVAESMAMQFPDFKGSPPVIGRDGQPINRNKGRGKGQPPSSSGHGGKGGKPTGFTKKVYLADQAEEGEAEQEHESAEGSGGDHKPDHAAADDADAGNVNDGDQDQDEAADLAEVAEVLSVTAKKLSGMRLGRKFAGGLKKGNPLRSLWGKGSLAWRPRVQGVWERRSSTGRRNQRTRAWERSQEDTAPNVLRAPC